MAERIRMGNDEFILHIRKHYACDIRNPQLGDRIARWLRENADGVVVRENQPAVWGEQIAACGELNLPRTSAVLEFRRDALPDLYAFLEDLATGRA